MNNRRPTMKLWVGDEPPDDTWTVAKTCYEAIRLLEMLTFTEISLDYDLGMGGSKGTVKTGYDVACWIEEIGEWRPPFIMHCHSANPVGRRRIQQVIDRVGKWITDEKDHSLETSSGPMFPLGYGALTNVEKDAWRERSGETETQ